MIVVKNVVLRRARLVILTQICLMLMACGNKGDLYLDQVKLTEEQKILLNELDELDGAETELETEKNKKKKTPAQQDATEPSS